MLRSWLIVPLVVLGSTEQFFGFQASTGSFQWRHNGRSLYHVDTARSRALTGHSPFGIRLIRSSGAAESSLTNLSWNDVTHLLTTTRTWMILQASTNDDDSSAVRSGRLRSVLRSAWRTITYPLRATGKLLRRDQGKPLKQFEEPNEDTETPPEPVADPSVVHDEADLVQRDNPNIAGQPMEPEHALPSGRASTGRQATGDRWAEAAPGVDLSGNWTILVSDEFRKQYDEYLKQLGQPFLVRSVALTIIPLTTEVTQQTENGRALFIRGTNARGVWERTLVSSGSDGMNKDFTPLKVPVVTADDERVQAEAWWEENGTVHRSFMLGLTKYGGGDFESKRYLEEGGKILVCESTFYPHEVQRDDVKITWRFLRNGEHLG